MQKKKLDELFQEKFSDFKEAPNHNVWRAIDASLDKKKKKRMIPFWWQLGGIAAALAITFLLFNPFSDTQTNDEIFVGTQQKVEETNSESVDKNLVDTPKVATEQLVEKTSGKSAKSQEKNQMTTKNQERVTQSTRKESSISKGDWSQNKNALVENRTKESKANAKDNASISTNNSTNGLGETLPNEASVENAQSNAKVVTSTENTDKNKMGFKGLESENAVTANETDQENQEISEADKKSIFDAIVNQEEEKQNTTTNRWSAGPSIAPVYFNAIGEGSPVHSIFVPNSKSGNINLSYGLSVAYAVSKKLTIRSGIHKVDYGYDTDDVTFSSSLNALSSNGQIASINYASTSKSLIISSKEVVSDKFNTTNSSLDVSAKSAVRDGFMSQQLGYLELPLEINYALVDKKFGVNLIGGVSSLFLIDNAVSLTAGELTTEIGEANNINDLNFSANMGIGLNYKFSPKIRFNLEPIFKYQLNTFSEIDGTFRPYSIGVYSGLSFKF